MTEITMQTQDAPDEDDPQETRLREALDILISKEGQRKIAEILGVDRKTIALSLQRDRLTPRMRLAIERELMGSDNPEHEHQKPPQDDIASTVGLLKEAVEDLTDQVEALTDRMSAIEERQNEMAPVPVTALVQVINAPAPPKSPLHRLLRILKKALP